MRTFFLFFLSSTTKPVCAFPVNEKVDLDIICFFSSRESARRFFVGALLDLVGHDEEES